MPRDPANFTYMQSGALGQEIAIAKSDGRVICQDGTRYTPNEVELLKERGASLRVHRVKKVFGGEVYARD